MRFTKRAMAIAIAGLLAGGQAYAQQPTSATAPARQSAYEYDSYYAQEPEAAAKEPAPAASTDGSCDKNGCAEKNGCGEESGCAGAAADDAAPEMCHLFECCFTKKWGLNIGGWTTQSFTWNTSNPADRFNGPVTWTDQANQYQLNQQYLFFDRPTNTGGDGWDLGGRVDLLYGTDYRFTTEAGLENKINTPNSPYMGLAIPQFYGEVAYNNLKVKLGHFYSPVGYFVVPTINNFFNTLPYTFQYGEPFTHTGMLATWTANEHWTLGGGFTRGWDNFSNANPHLGSLATATWTGDNKDSLAWVWVQSHEPDANSGGIDPPVGGRVYTSRFLQTLVYSKPITDKLTWVAQSDLGVQGAAFGAGTRTARWYGLNQYLFYKVSDSWTWGASYEWFRDEEGFRVGAAVPSVFSPNSSGNAVGPGFAGNFCETTWGPQWRPGGSQNLLIRPNLRWDWYNGGRNSAGQLPYDSGTRSQQFIWGTDVTLIY
jgi:Putative beta-barrel porin-2, OmpL-like. bbp2